MARYYFHTVNGEKVLDSEGRDLSGLEAAKRLAVKFTGDLLSLEHHDVFEQDLSVQVTNDAGLLLFSIAVMGNVAQPAAR
jgi:hypothetical protein